MISYIALAAMVAAAAAFARNWLSGTYSGAHVQPTHGKIHSGIYSFLAGVLLANSIPHFIHGISGESFPAPLFQTLGRGPATDVANVLWGLFCFGMGYRLVVIYRQQLPSILFHILACGGFVAMSIVLSIVFSKGAFR
jgi:hypothetical protein